MEIYGKNGKNARVFIGFRGLIAAPYAASPLPPLGYLKASNRKNYHPFLP
jgi:hypothetical protein